MTEYFIALDVHQPNSLKRSLLKQQVSLYHDRVRERVRQGNQLAPLWRFKSKAALRPDNRSIPIAKSSSNILNPQRKRRTNETNGNDRET